MEGTRQRKSIMNFLSACVRAELKNCDVEYLGVCGEWDDPSDQRVADIAEGVLSNAGIIVPDAEVSP